MSRRILLVYAAVMGLLAAALYLGLGLVEQLAGVQPNVWIIAALLVVAGAALQPLAQITSRQLDRWWFREKAALADLERSLISELAPHQNIGAMAKFLTTRLRRALNVRTTCLLVADARRELYRVVALAGDPPGGVADAEQTILGVNASAAALRDAMARLDAEHALPVQLEDRQVGLLTIGPPLGSVALDDEDLARLRTIASQTAAMLENARVFDLATRDSLTGVPRRRVFNDRLNAEVQRCRRSGLPFSIVMADIDNFKRVNDTLGHQAGDQVLSRIAAGFTQDCRSTDVVARYGGEEFVLLLVDTDNPGALVVAEKLRARAAATTITLASGEEIRVTVSFGVASFDPSRQESAEELLHRADEALYRAKSEGKNRVCAA